MPLTEDDARPRLAAGQVAHALGLQLRHPQGAVGALVGRLMAFVNDKPNRLAVDALDLRPADTVLELGFGPGRSLRAIAARTPEGRAFGMDQSARMLKQATACNHAAVASGRMTLLQGPFSPLPWGTATFDKVLLVNVAYFFDVDGRDMSEVYRVVRPGGRVVLYVTARETMKNWPFSGSETHRLFDAADLVNLFARAGFSAADVKLRSVRLPMGIAGFLAVAEKVR